MEDTNVHGERIYQVIDWQQRLETIREFREDGFPTMNEKEIQRRYLKFDPIGLSVFRGKILEERRQDTLGQRCYVLKTSANRG